jgi:hypothetical protein
MSDQLYDDLGRLAYEAYERDIGHYNDMESWYSLPYEMKKSWRAVGEALMEHIAIRQMKQALEP